MKSKNKKSLDSFTKYCEKYPEQRFWQCLRNWAKVDYIYTGKYDKEVDDIVAIDTFYEN